MREMSYTYFTFLLSFITDAVKIYALIKLKIRIF